VHVPIPVALAIAAVCVIGLLYYLANRAVYYPSKYPDGNWDTQKLVGASDAWITTSDGVKIHGWWVQRRQDGISTPGVVPRKTPGGTQPDGGRAGSPLVTLFLHGNAGNISPSRAAHPGNRRCRIFGVDAGLSRLWQE
jgi:hypothetical protein